MEEKHRHMRDAEKMASDFERLMSKPHLQGPKRQHYVLRFYLDGFAREGFVSVFDRKTGGIARQTPENTGVIGHLYTFEDHQNRRRFDMERMFSVIEGRAAPIIRKLVAGERLQFEDFDNFTTFVALAAVRTPAAIAEMQTVEEGIMKARMLAEFGDEAAALRYLRAKEAPAIDEAKLKRMAENLTRMVREDRYRIHVDSSNAFARVVRNFHAIARELWERDWLVVRPASEGDKFLTSDSPVVLTTTSSQARGLPLGYGSPHGQVLFPLADRCALVISGHRKRFGRASLPPDMVRRFNLTVAADCHRYCFAADPALLESIEAELGLTKQEWKSRLDVGTVRRGGALYAFIRGRAR